MSEAFRVDPQALADAVQQMAEFTRHAESMITEIDSLVSNLHAAWSGEAAAAHAEAHRHWVAGEEMMRAALSRLRAAGETAHANYTGAMSTNLAMWS
ncbi:WXG100 family type VII secretion target [Mycobacterium angelicum]|uniref:WXG100 family type VII secretion target n=1 Tax=Mycobacterium angelicum TaxID=470074 RepID=A0A1W9ZVN7_MYCAN|nr:WXG100 family type VII secretion target [Mycobacterium angelicum]MCV7198385.1 WXG100 family type VII secretion target [Mycobacterium angelicum]ORA21870.1 WXG100 family type VII secretion target [Mycobacterium angelicum]